MPDSPANPPREPADPGKSGAQPRGPIWREPDGTWWFENEYNAYGPFETYEECSNALYCDL